MQILYEERIISHILWPNMIHIFIFHANTKEIVTLHRFLWPNWTITITLHALTQEIITVDVCYEQFFF